MTKTHEQIRKIVYKSLGNGLMAYLTQKSYQLCSKIRNRRAPLADAKAYIRMEMAIEILQQKEWYVDDIDPRLLVFSNKEIETERVRIQHELEKVFGK